MIGSGEASSGAGLTISGAAEAWGVSRDTVKRWVRCGAVEATKDNLGIWRVALGQQPPPAGLGKRGPRDAPGAARGDTAGDDLGASAAAELAVARREVELLRERLVEVQAERDRLGELLKMALEGRGGVSAGDRLGRAVERLRAALRSAMEALQGVGHGGLREGKAPNALVTRDQEGPAQG